MQETVEGVGFSVPLQGTWRRRARREERQGRSVQPLFKGVFLGEFECSHRLENGKRLDLIKSTRHEDFADEGDARLRSLGMTACRDGISGVWAEQSCDTYDFSAVQPMLPETACPIVPVNQSASFPGRVAT